MLGYVKPDKPELKIKEFELYSGYYCGICKSIGQRYGQLPRMALNYDSVFLAILLASIHAGNEQISAERCIVHPIKKRTIVRNSPEIDYAADILLLLAYYKLKDDYEDDKSMKAAVGTVLMKGTFQKLLAAIPDKSEYVKKQLAELSNLEKEKCPSIDRSAEPFAKLMEEVFDAPRLHNTEFSEEHHKILRRIGYHIGKWIYLIDAYDDIEENVKQKTFNPLILQFRYLEKDEAINSFKDRIKERVETNLILYLADIANSCSKLKFEKNQGLIENILYLGLMRKTEEILQKKGTEKNAESI